MKSRNPLIIAVAACILMAAAWPAVRAEAQRPVGAPDAEVELQVLAEGPTCAESMSHFPLQAGNEWVYERRGSMGPAEIWRMAVLTAQDAPGATWTLDGFQGTCHCVTLGANGELCALPAGGGSPGLWYRLNAAVGETWTLDAPDDPTGCLGGATLRLASHSDSIKVPAGDFQNVVRIDYEQPCMDAGVVSEWFAPEVGLVQRLENSFAGPVVSQLLSAKVGGRTIPDTSWATSLTLDRPIFSVTPSTGSDPGSGTITGTFRVLNQGADPVELQFAGCVSATLTILDLNGKVVFEGRADDGGCCECKNIVTVQVKSGDLFLPVAIPLYLKGGTVLPEGRYAVEARFNTLEPLQLRPAASAAVSISVMR